MTSLRTKAASEAYRAYRESGGLGDGCVLCKKEAIQTFQFWKIIPNDFPYDRVALVHHMLIPKRHARETELTTEEREEYLRLKDEDSFGTYDFLMEATHRNKSILDHFHIHLIVIDENKK